MSLITMTSQDGGVPMTTRTQRAENLHAHGLVDAVIAPGELAAFLDRVLTAITAEPRSAPRPGPAPIAAGPA